MYARTSIRRRRKSRWPLAVVLIGIILVGWGLVRLGGAAGDWLSDRNPIRTISRAPVAAAPTPTPTPTPRIDMPSVERRWQAILADYPRVTVGAVFRDIASGQQVSIGGERDFRAASTAKLIAASYFLNQVEEKKLTLDQRLGSYPSGYQLQQMIQQSNNTSWELFLQLLGRSNEQRFAHDQGWKSFNVTTNHLAPMDLADLLTALWQGKLLSKEHTDLLLSYMQHTNDETWIPPAVPAGATVYHKYGALEDDIHDAALVRWNGRVYALVIMTNGQGTYAYTTRAELFHKLVRAALSEDREPEPPPSASRMP